MYGGMPWVAGTVIAVLSVAILSWLISIPSLKLKGDYFVLASLAFQSVVFGVLMNWITVTRGPYGISNVPRPSVAGYSFESDAQILMLSVLLASACALTFYLIGNSPFGRALRALREDELATMALGKNTYALKTRAFVLACIFAALAGTLFAGYTRYIDPSSFNLAASLSLVAMVIIGGTGNIAGPMVGTLVIFLLPEALRFLNIPDSIAANVRQLIYGLLIIVVLRLRPQGIAGELKLK